ncbi:putative Fe-S oxidoreductase [Candidatus Methanoperedens nitroreducens]|uniref:Putative Fe-S oxidoreductase n=1 Tax=Candidatus Methanoperedens nitratireducens TaxID=1392998 RepID=A0A062V962_9EURY|nr:YkgJ family cysteine cluster protein [Candidatus Methanoperedens nitroreducens]KCZ73073.1 putative Fe-S oxidoreductase [Candidatus Methanoperedens nitroreducens]MDJ1422981.1 YkgJ family cysteine cluster protein [Candidatus Methanoperedens sp.]
MMKETKIRNLRGELDEAIRIDERQLADSIRAIGFRCRKCAQCCRAEHGDNTVSIFPFEIRRICERTGLEPEDIVTPTPSLDTDSEGNIHTFEWVLRKDGDCIFLKSGLCKIYECRPYICKTYPFYLLEGRLMVSECMGLGGVISSEESQRIATLLKERYITEIKESILLLERFNGFNGFNGLNCLNPDSMRNICVHDSEGEHWVPERDKIRLI